MNNILCAGKLAVSGAVTFDACEFIEEDQAAYLRCCFELAAPEKLPVNISGIAGYRLYLDNEFLHCGPEWNCFGLITLDNITLNLSAGKHTLTVMLWHHGLKESAYREMSRHAFFVLQSDHDSPAAHALDTATGDYQSCLLNGWQLCKHHMSCMAGPRLNVDFHQNNEYWFPAVKLDCQTLTNWGYTFTRRELPLDFVENYRNFTLRSSDIGAAHLDKFYEKNDAEAARMAAQLIAGAQVTIPPHKQIRMLFDLNNYICARAVFDADNGSNASVEILLTESLFENSDDWVTCYKNPLKGNRSAIDGKYAVGNGDKFTFDGNFHHCPVLDWDAGRYMICYINTAETALTIENFHLEQTHSGIILSNPIKFADDNLNKVADLCVTSLRNCMHTTYMDCPHYEQLMYIGDGRIEALLNYVCAPGSMLQRKALKTFASSIGEAGFTQSRYPSRETSFIPGFSLFFINMLHDYAMWSNDKSCVAELIHSCRKVLQAFARHHTGDGLCRTPDGWNFYDWVPGWERGVPPAENGECALLNLHYLKALQDAAELEDYIGDPAAAAALRKTANQLQVAIQKAFFVPEKGLYSNDSRHLHYSQHVQAMALLCSLGNRELYEKMFDPALDLAQCTIYFSHYLFEAAKIFQDTVHPLEMMKFWLQLPENGFLTTPERPEPSRSDCHAWGGHLLYYFVTGLGGLTPAEPGGKCFNFAPGKLDHPMDFVLELPLADGSITVKCKNNQYTIETTGNITLK